MNNTFEVPGRFGNILILNILCSRIAKKYNLKFDYKWLEQSNELGLSLFTDGTCVFDNTILFDDDDFERFIENEDLTSNIVIRKHHQTPSCAHQIKKYILTPEIRNSIIYRNVFRDRYDHNNDVYIHVRLDDAHGFNPGYEYYDKVLSSITFDNGFISSDGITHTICSSLIDKYNLKIVDFNYEDNKRENPSYNEILTIMFASTCKHIVCSGGTFSWIIGVLGNVAANPSNVYYHSSNRDKIWFGDMFVFEEWNLVL